LLNTPVGAFMALNAFPSLRPLVSRVPWISTFRRANSPLWAPPKGSREAPERVPREDGGALPGPTPMKAKLDSLKKIITNLTNWFHASQLPTTMENMDLPCIGIF
jgi:hypothetical protein